MNPIKAFSFPLNVMLLQASTFVVEHSSGFFCCLLDRNLNILWLGLLSVGQEITANSFYYVDTDHELSGTVRQSLSGLGTLAILQGLVLKGDIGGCSQATLFLSTFSPSTLDCQDCAVTANPPPQSCLPLLQAAQILLQLNKIEWKVWP